MKRRLLILTVLVLALALTMNLGVGFAATKKSVYVVKSMTIKNVNPSGTTTTTVSFKYTDKGLLKKFDGGDYYYGTYKYDGKKLKSSEVQRGDGVPEKCKYTWKNGRVSKVVRTMAANSNYKVITTIKYKKISVPSTYLKLVKKQRNHILMDHAYQTRVSNFPLGRL